MPLGGSCSLIYASFSNDAESLEDSRDSGRLLCFCPGRVPCLKCLSAPLSTWQAPLHVPYQLQGYPPTLPGRYKTFLPQDFTVLGPALHQNTYLKSTTAFCVSSIHFVDKGNYVFSALNPQQLKSLAYC